MVSSTWASWETGQGGGGWRGAEANEQSCVVWPALCIARQCYYLTYIYKLYFRYNNKRKGNLVPFLIVYWNDRVQGNGGTVHQVSIFSPFPSIIAFRLGPWVILANGLWTEVTWVTFRPGWWLKVNVLLPFFSWRGSLRGHIVWLSDREGKPNLHRTWCERRTCVKPLRLAQHNLSGPEMGPLGILHNKNPRHFFYWKAVKIQMLRIELLLIHVIQ